MMVGSCTLAQGHRKELHHRRLGRRTVLECRTVPQHEAGHRRMVERCMKELHGHYCCRIAMEHDKNCCCRREQEHGRNCH